MFQSKERASGPFSAPLNDALSEAFDGASLAGLSVERGADAANRAFGALALTQGNRIALSSSVREDPGDARSMNVIAHEVAHALAGGGAGRTLVDREGDPGERAADDAGDAFAHYADGGMQGPAPRLEPAHGGQAEIHRFEIEGPWDYGDPVHETLTAETLAAAAMVPPGTDYTDPRVWEYTRGAMWNDDPSSQLFESGGSTREYSTGVEWTTDFQDFETAASTGQTFGVGDPLLARSHFGDLQSLHSMAGADGEDPQVTKQKIMMWAEFTTKVAEGRIGGDTNVGKVMLDNPMFSQLIGDDPNLGGESVSQLFGIQGDKGNVQARATGSLLHMIQDSYAAGHVERDDLGGGSRGNIENFHSYVNQDHDAHAAADALPLGYDSPAEAVHAMPGGEDAIANGAVVLTMIEAGADPDEVLDFLSNNTYKTAPGIGPFDRRRRLHPGARPRPRRARGEAGLLRPRGRRRPRRRELRRQGSQGALGLALSAAARFEGVGCGHAPPPPPGDPSGPPPRASLAPGWATYCARAYGNRDRPSSTTWSHLRRARRCRHAPTRRSRSRSRSTVTVYGSRPTVHGRGCQLPARLARRVRSGRALDCDGYRPQLRPAADSAGHLRGPLTVDR